MCELVSRTWPGPSGWPRATTSLPVGSRATFGRGTTGTAGTWPASSAPKSAALSSLIAARGLVEVPLGVEGLDEGVAVSVLLL